MKKAAALTVLSLICIAMILPCSAAYASGEVPYAVIGDDVWLLDKDGGEKIFLLPKTYYARIDNLGGDFYYITFNGISGKIDRAKVSAVGYSGEVKSTLQEIAINPKYYVFTEIKLLSSLGANSRDLPVPVGASLIFLGKYPSDDMYYYVRYNDVLGYVKAEFTTKPALDTGEFTPSSPTAEKGVNASDGAKKKTDVVKILVITALCVILVILIIVIFKPTKSKKNRYYYEE